MAGYYVLPDEEVADNPAAYLSLLLTAIDEALYPEAFVEEDQAQAYGKMQDLRAWLMLNFPGC